MTLSTYSCLFINQPLLFSSCVLFRYTPIARGASRHNRWIKDEKTGWLSGGGVMMRYTERELLERTKLGGKKDAVSLPGMGLFPSCLNHNPPNPIYIQTKSTRTPLPPCQWGTIKHTNVQIYLFLEDAQYRENKCTDYFCISQHELQMFGRFLSKKKKKKQFYHFIH